MRILKVGLLMFLTSSCLFAATIRVPQDLGSIQEGIDSAVSGDTVLVGPGLYVENVNFSGKRLVLMSSAGPEQTTIFAFDETISTVSLVNYELQGTVVRGFTITGSNATGVKCFGSSATIEDNIITDNGSAIENAGAGIALYNTANTVIRGNKIYANHPNTYAGAISVGDDGRSSTNDKIYYNLIYDNLGIWDIRILGHVTGLVISNNTIAAPSYGAVYNQSNNTISALNNIICYCPVTGMGGDQPISNDYNCFFANNANLGFAGGPGNIYANALFVDYAARDFHLQTESPCINAGDPNPAYNDPDGTRNDIGALYAALQSLPGAAWINFGSEYFDNVVHTFTPTIYWTFVDTLTATQSGYEIEVGTDSNWIVAEVWQPGQQLSSATSVMYAGTALLDHQMYFLRLRVFNGVEWGQWSYAYFSTSIARTIRVPQDQETIQAGINAARDGDTVLVSPGSYPGQVEFLGKSVVLTSTGGPSVTFIYPPIAPAIKFTAGEPLGTEISGFTFRYTAGDNHILCLNGSYPTVKNNVFESLSANLVIIAVGGANAVIERNVFANNFVGNACIGVPPGGAATIINNTFYGNSRGFYSYGPTVAKNNIVTNCTDYGIFGQYSDLSYNNSFANGQNYDGGAVAGIGSISADPLFVNPGIKDFHLQSFSPCINSGDPALIYNDPNDSRNDMGAFPFVPPVVITSLQIIGETDLLHIVGETPEFSWTYQDINGQTQTQFNIAVGTDNDWQFAEMWNPAPINSDMLNVLYGGIPLTDNHVYWLRLRIRTDSEWSEWSELMFRMNSLPSIPELRTPIQGSDVIDEVPLLTLHQSSDAEVDSLLYTVDVSQDNFSSVLYRYSVRSSADSLASVAIDSVLTMYSQYWWRAKASDYYEESNWSPVWSFFLSGPKNLFVDCTNGDDAGTGRYSDPFQTINHAIAVADTSDSIFVFPGECQQTVIIAKPVNLISLNGPNVTTIRGVTGYRCILVDGVVEDTVRIEGFTITGGSPNQLDDLYYNGGGGILAHYSLVSIDNCVIVNNVAETAGGGILFRKDTNFRLTNSTVCHNQALTSSGGGVATVDAASGTIARTAIAGNTAELNGGGVFFWGGTPEYYGRDFVMTTNVVVNNLATEGGAGVGARRADLDLRSNIVVNNQRAGGANPLFGVYASESSLITTNDYNGVFANAGGQNYNPDIVVGAHSLSADPQFAGDTACASFALDPCSPFVDRGDPSVAPLEAGGAQSDIGIADISAEDCEYRSNRVWVGPVSYIDCSRFRVPVWFVNDIDVVAAIAVPLRWSSSQVVYDSIRWQGSRVNDWEINLATANNANRTLLIGATRFEAAPTSPDSGLLCQLFFHSQDLLEGANVCFDTTFIPPGGEFVFADIDARTLYPSYQTHCFDFAPPCARVNIPNGDELYVGHNIETLAWKLLSDDVDSTVVRLSTDGGAAFNTVLQTVVGPDTAFAWNVPVLWEEDCRVQVTQFRPGGIVEQDQSDAMFALHSIGDVDCSNQLNIVDVLCLINHIFSPVTDPCDCVERAKDANCDTKFNIVDVVHLVNFIFSSGPAPCPDIPPAGKLTTPTLALATAPSENGDEIILSTNSDFELAAVEIDLTIPARMVSKIDLLDKETGLQLYWGATGDNSIKIGVIDPTGQSAIAVGAVNLIRIELTDKSLIGNYNVSGIAVDRDAAEYSFTSLRTVSVLPTNYRLEQNQPNPFNPATSITYALPMAGRVELMIFNILGNPVRTIVDATMPAGTYVAKWDGRSESNETMPSGVYFYRLKTGSFEETKKMLLLK